GPGARRAHPPLAHQLLPEVRMSYPWWATALIAAGTFLAGVKIGRIERAEERALDEADDLAGLAAAVGYNLEADDHPTPAPATVACRRGEWIEKAAAWAAARLVGVAAWWDELRAAWGVDRSPTWQP